MLPHCYNLSVSAVTNASYCQHPVGAGFHSCSALVFLTIHYLVPVFLFLVLLFLPNWPCLSLDLFSNNFSVMLFSVMMSLCLTYIALVLHLPMFVSSFVSYHTCCLSGQKFMSSFCYQSGYSFLWLPTLAVWPSKAWLHSLEMWNHESFFIRSIIMANSLGMPKC